MYAEPYIITFMVPCSWSTSLVLSHCLQLPHWVVHHLPTLWRSIDKPQDRVRTEDAGDHLARLPRGRMQTCSFGQMPQAEHPFQPQLLTNAILPAVAQSPVGALFAKTYIAICSSIKYASGIVRILLMSIRRLSALSNHFIKTYVIALHNSVCT